MPNQDTAGRKPGPAPACTMIIFGAGGDLTKRLVMPALYDLAGAGLLDGSFKVIGVDHASASVDEWRKSLHEAMISFTKDPTAEFHPSQIDEKTWGWLSERLSYTQGDFEKPETFSNLAQQIKGNALFYLAVAPRFFGVVAEGLGGAKLLEQTDGAYRRLIVEKPFGSDLASAQALNAQLLKLADESQIYRIDHFLGKEVVQSVMAIRFANGIFEPMWRREYVDFVEITAAETVGVEERGAFYEPTGALRDMVPNHLFQLVSVVATEPPNSFDAEDVRDEKARLLKAIRPVTPENAVRGQYAAGQEQGKQVPAYRDEPHVDHGSRTETYVALRLQIENWRWSGVPFYLRTGKRMTGRLTEIAVHFKAPPYQMFRDTPVDHLKPNVMRLQIDPREGSRTEFNAKVPGPAMELGSVATTFRYGDFFKETPSVGYETLIYDCLRGDATLFQRADAIEASWSAVQPLLEAWAKPDAGVEMYAAGSPGPDAADALLAADGHRWSGLDSDHDRLS